MAVPISNVTRRVVFAPSGTGPYAFTFEILAATDIEVYKGDTLLTLTTDYTVTINANGTGSVTLVLTAGTDNITIVGARAIERLSDFVTGGDFFANTVNSELDSLTIFAQQNAEAVTRSIQAPVTDPTTIDMTLPVKADRAGKYLSFNTSTGDPEVVNTVVDVTAVAANATNINTVAGISSNVTTVAGVAANVTTVAGIAANVTTVAGVSADVTTVAGISADVTAVAGDATDIGTVAGIAADVTSVAGISADVTAVAADATDIGTVATDLAGSNTIGTVAGIAANVSTVAGISADVTTVAADGADIGAVAAIDSDVTTVAGIAANVTTVAGVSADVTTVAGISADVTTVATNVTDITNFSDVYLGPAATDPATRNDSSALQAGDLYFNTVDDAIKVYTGSAWVTAYITAAGFVNLADAQTITGVKTFDNGLATDTISEETAAAGVTIDGVLLKDGGASVSTLNTSGAVVFNDAGADVDFRVEGDTDANLLFVDASADKIGIGTNAPSEVLHLKSATADKPVILLENTTSNDTTTGNAPSIRFYSNDSNQAGIPDNAELGIIEFRGDDKDGGSDRNYAQIKGLAADPGGTYKGAITFSTSNGAVPAERGRFDSDGLKFNGDTAAANALDDYEEGTWTPVLQGSSTAGTYVYDTDRTNGIYIKIGKMVTIFGCYRISAVTSAGTGDGRITGLPFTSAVIDTSWDRSPGLLRVQTGPTLTNNGYFCITEGSTYLVMGLQGVATWAAILVTDADFLDAIWFFQITYEAA